jgi:hypothetical protein
MSKTPMIAAFAAMMAVSPLALAAESATTTTTDASPSVTSTRIESGQIRATDIKGSNVYNSQDKKIASVKDMIVSPDGRIAAVVLDVDGKYVAVGMRALTLAMNDKKLHISTEMSEQQLKSRGAFDLDTKPASNG